MKKTRGLALKWFQFRVSTIGLVVILLSLFLSGVSYVRSRSRQAWQYTNELEKHGNIIVLHVDMPTQTGQLYSRISRMCGMSFPPPHSEVVISIFGPECGFAISQLPNISKVRFSPGADLCDEELVWLEKCQRVEIVVVDGSRLTNKSLESLSALRSLKDVTLRFTDVNDAGLMYISRNMVSMEGLNVFGSPVTHEGINFLQSLPKLQKLTLGGEQFNGKWSLSISAFNKLETLEILESTFTAEDVSNLKRVPSLKLLRLVNVKCDEGVLEYASNALPNLHIDKISNPFIVRKPFRISPQM